MFHVYFRTILRDMQCQINLNLVFHVSEDGSEIELKHCASSDWQVKYVCVHCHIPYNS